MQSQTIEEINARIQAELKAQYTRPKQIMEQEKFNAFMLGTLNRLALQQSKGKMAFQVIEENAHLLSVVFAYLNRSENDDLLKYSREIKVEHLDGTGTVVKTEFRTETITLSLEKGLALIGNFGIGKTLLLKAIQTNMRELSLTGFLFTARQVFDTFKVTGRDAYESNQKDLYAIAGHDRFGFFLDDLGAEPQRSVKFGEEDTPMGNFLMHRFNEWDRLRISQPEKMMHDPKPFITSNVPIPKLQEGYGGRVISRLYGACNVLICNQNTDFRKS